MILSDNDLIIVSGAEFHDWVVNVPTHELLDRESSSITKDF